MKAPTPVSALNYHPPDKAPETKSIHHVSFAASAAGWTAERPTVVDCGPTGLRRENVKADIDVEPLMPFPVSEQRIIDAEQALGRTLPQELRQRLRHNNGGEVVVEDDNWLLHPVWDPTNRQTIGRTASHILVETAEARSWASFPPDGVSLASNGSGDRLITCRNDDRIFLWEHETGECLPVEAEWQ